MPSSPSFDVARYSFLTSVPSRRHKSPPRRCLAPSWHGSAVAGDGDGAGFQGAAAPRCLGRGSHAECLQALRAPYLLRNYFSRSSAQLGSVGPHSFFWGKKLR